MAKADDYGLREFIGKETLTHQEQQTRFERTQKAMSDWRESGGQGALGDFYEWLGIGNAEPEPKMAIEDSQR